MGVGNNLANGDVLNSSGLYPRERSEERLPQKGSGQMNSDSNLKEKDALDDFMRPNLPIQ